MSPTAQAATLLKLAAIHRAKSLDYLNNSTASMYQHQQDADRLEQQAAQLTKATA
jgi:hypothetical protein